MSDEPLESRQSSSDDPRVDWGPGEWADEVERLRAELGATMAENEYLRRLVVEARAMIPHADEPSGRRFDWCARADGILS